LLVVGALPGAAQQFRFRMLGQDEGLLNSNVHAILQDRTGFFWLATENGLFRYDGAEFTRFASSHGLPAAYITGLAESSDGTLWVSAHNGLARREQGRFLSIPIPGVTRISAISAGADGSLLIASAEGTYRLRDSQLTQLGGGPAAAILAARDGSAWFDCTSQICRVDPEGHTSRFGPAAGVPAANWTSLVQDSNGDILARGGAHLIALSPAQAAFRPAMPAPPGVPTDGGEAVVHLGPAGTLLTTTARGFAVRSQNSWQWISPANGLPAGPLTALFEDREGSIWVGVGSEGLARWAGRDRWESWNGRDGLKNEVVESVAVDAAGRAWIATASALSILHPRAANSPGSITALRSGFVTAIALGTDSVWTAFDNADGLVRWNLRTLQPQRLGPPPGLPSVTVRSLHIDSRGDLWAASLQGLFVGPTNGGRPLRRFQPPDAASGDLYLEVAESRDGKVWVATTRGLLCWNGSAWRRFGTAEGLRRSRTRHVAAHPDGSLLVSYSDALGVSRLWFDAKSNIRETWHYDATSGLGSDRIYAIAVDAQQRIWTSSDRGIDVLDKQRWIHHDRSSGLIWNDCMHSALWIDGQEGVWVGTRRGLAHFLPQASRRPLPAPRIAVTAWRLGEHHSQVSFGPEGAPGLPSINGSAGLELSLSAFSFASDQPPQFRYRLHGLDPGWIETSHREVRYPALGPGSYVFEAYSLSPLGGVSPRPVRFSFTIGAPWWHSGWAVAAALIGLILLIRLAWTIRMRIVFANQRLLEDSVRARTATIESQKQEIHRLLLEAQRANHAKSTFLATMSHEIRTPLNGVVGMADLLLLANTLESEQQSQAEALRKSALDLLRLLNDLLDMAKIEAGKLTLESAPFRLEAALLEVTGLMSGLAREKSLTLEPDFQLDGLVLAGDAARIRQVVSNLLTNAIKFSERGTITLRAAAVAVTPDWATVQIAVEDQGIGIPADRLEHVFDAFEQAEASTSRRFGGTGLGLAICRELVESMGGTIAVTSRVGEGSRFHFTLTLPRVERLPEPDSVAAATAAVPAGTRVLLCEDNPVNQRVATRMLEMLGHSVTLARDGREAIERYQESSFDVVLMDLMMPEVDGIEATRRIREMEHSAGRRTPIVALTASAFREDVERCLACGMDGFVSKPFVRQSLVEELQRVLPSGELPRPGARAG
jgi:signal transduction histidine kinase/ligand-binding sensor domain-containing protein/ActR/RegA family two-component response regulator